MAYFMKDAEGNLEYSYYGVCDCVDAHYVNPTGIEAYIEDETFEQAVVRSYENIDLSGDNEKNVNRVLAKMERTANWLRKKMEANRFD